MVIQYVFGVTRQEPGVCVAPKPMLEVKLWEDILEKRQYLENNNWNDHMEADAGIRMAL